MVSILDKTTFERLFREEFKGLVVFAIQYVKDYEAAREIVQEAFVNMWSRREQIDPSKAVKSYLVTSVKNRSLNYLRDNKKFDSNLLILEDLYPLPVYQQSDHLVESELKEQITLAIKELPEKCREVFLLNRDEHLKYQEIADQLQISVKTVETQMSKALQHMRKKLRDYLIVLCLISLMPDPGYRMPLLRHVVPRNDSTNQLVIASEAKQHHFTTSRVHHLTTSPPHHLTTIRVNLLSCVLLSDK